MLKHGPEIIIATPGRLWDLIKEKHPHLQNLRQVRLVGIPTRIVNGHHNSYFFGLEQLFMFVVVFRCVVLFYWSSCRFTTMILEFINNYTASLQCAFYLSWAESPVFPHFLCFSRNIL